MSVGNATDGVKMNGHSHTNGIHKPYDRAPTPKAWISDQAKMVAVALFCLGVMIFVSYLFGEYMKLDPRPSIKFACCAGILLVSVLAIAVLENMTKICGGYYVCC